MKIGQVGLGYVGLVNAAVLSNHGNHVIGVDVDHSKIDALTKGMVPIFEPDLEKYLINGRKNLIFSDDYSALSECEAIFITVPTPNISLTNEMSQGKT